MNKLFTKITSLALGAAMMIGVGVSVASNNKAGEVSAADTTVTWTATAANNLGNKISSKGGTATGSVTLTDGGSNSYSLSYTRTLVNLKSGKSDNIQFMGSTWIQLGSSNALESLSFNTSAISGVIKSVSVVTATAGTHKLTIDVGGTKYKDAASITSYSNSASATNPDPSNCVETGTGTSTGAITITIASSATTTNKAMLIRSVSVTYGPASIPTTSVGVSPASVTLAPNGTQQLTTTVLPANTTDTLTFSSSAAGVATVTSSGLITAVADGTATITATSGNYSDTCVVTVKTPTTPFITPSKSSTSGFTGCNETISFSYGNLTGSLSVSSSNTSVVTVGSPSYEAGEGTVQFNFVGAGSTTVKFYDGSTELASVSVKVNASSVTITGLAATDNVYIGQTLDLGSTITVTATGSYSNAVSWSSDDTSIATVTSAGVVTGVSEGEAEITVTSKDYPSATMTCTVTVSKVVSYELVTNDADLTEGSQLLFVCGSKNVAMAAQNGTYRDKTEVSISNNSITNPSSSVKVVTLEGAAGAWYLSTDEGYLTSTTAKNLTSTAQKANAITWDISITNNNASIDGGTVGTIQYNASSPRFAPYTSTQTAIQIYGILAEESGTKIHLSAENIVMNYGDADVTPVVKNADTQEVISGCTFESGNTSVVTIVNGKIHAVSKGTATITVNHDPDVQQEITYRSTTFTVTVNKADTIQDLYSYSSGTKVNFNGYYAGEYADGIVLMDGDYGVLVYKATSESSWVVDETIINVSGSTTSYGGLLEISQGSTVTELTGSEATAAAAKLNKPQNQDLTLIDPSTATLDLASRRTYVSGTLKSCTASGSNYNIVVTVNEKDVDLYLKAADDVNVELSTGTMKISAYLLDNVGNQVTIKGFTSFYSNNFQVRVYDVVEAVSSYTAADFAQDVLNDTDTVCSSSGESHDHKDALATIWSSLEAKWNTLAVAEQNEWQNTTKYTPDYENDSEEVIENGLGRYNYLCKKYSFSNFTHRSDVNDAPVAVQQSIINIFGFDNDGTATTTAIIIIVSVIGLTALGGFFFLRKRKEI